MLGKIQERSPVKREKFKTLGKPVKKAKYKRVLGSHPASIEYPND